MKNFFLSFSLLVVSGLAIVGCNNGAYDANPDTTGGPTGGGSVGPEGEVSAKFNGTLVTCKTGYYGEILGRTIVAVKMGSSSTDLESISIAIDPYEGIKVYETIEDRLSPVVAYTKQSASAATVYANGGNGGHVKVEVKEDVDGRMSGVFEGVIYNTTAGGNPKDSLVVTDGKFNVKKQ